MPTVKVSLTGDASNLKQATGQAQTALGGVQKAAAGLQSGMMAAGVAIAGVTAAIATAKKAYEQTVGAVIEYNKAILDASRATRMSTEDLSRFVQVGQGVGVGMDAITRSLQLATKNGFAPSIDAIANLADKTNAMTSPTEKAATLAKILGRNWATLDPILELGGKRIRDLAAAQEGGLVVTEAEIQKTEKLRTAMDEVGKSIHSTLLELGLLIATPIAQQMDVATQFTGDWNLAIQSLKAQGIEPTRQAIEGLYRDITTGAAAGEIEIERIRSGIAGLPQRTNLEVVTYHWDEQGMPKGYEHPSKQEGGFWWVWDSGAGHYVRSGKAEGAPATPRAIGGLATPGLHLVGEEGPELIRTDNRGNIHVLRASVTRMLSKGVAAMAHALEPGSGMEKGWKRPVGDWRKEVARGAATPTTASAAPTASVQEVAAQAVAEAAAVAVPQAVAAATRMQSEAVQRMVSDNAKSNARTSRTLDAILQAILLQGGARDIGQQVAAALQTADLGR